MRSLPLKKTRDVGCFGKSLTSLHGARSQWLITLWGHVAEILGRFQVDIGKTLAVVQRGENDLVCFDTLLPQMFLSEAAQCPEHSDPRSHAGHGNYREGFTEKIHYLAVSPKPSGSIAKSGWLVKCLRGRQRGVEA